MDHGDTSIVAAVDDGVLHHSSCACDRTICRQRVCDRALPTEVSDAASSTSASVSTVKEK